VADGSVTEDVPRERLQTGKSEYGWLLQDTLMIRMFGWR
jgi:hypothetical protein